MRAAHPARPFQRDRHCFGRVERLVQLAVNALKHRQFVHAGCQRLIGSAEQPGIVDSDGRLTCEGVQEFQVTFGEQARPHAVIDISHADDLAAYPQRTRHDTAQRVRHDALLPGKARVFLRIGRDDSLPGAQHVRRYRAAQGKRIRVERGLVEVAGHTHVQVAVVVEQHQEAALGPGQLDNGVHHLIEHRLQVER